MDPKEDSTYIDVDSKRSQSKNSNNKQTQIKRKKPFVSWSLQLEKFRADEQGLTHGNKSSLCRLRSCRLRSRGQEPNVQRAITRESGVFRENTYRTCTVVTKDGILIFCGSGMFRRLCACVCV